MLATVLLRRCCLTDTRVSNQTSHTLTPLGVLVVRIVLTYFSCCKQVSANFMYLLSLFIQHMPTASPVQQLVLLVLLTHGPLVRPCRTY